MSDVWSSILGPPKTKVVWPDGLASVAALLQPKGIDTHEKFLEFHKERAGSVDLQETVDPAAASIATAAAAATAGVAAPDAWHNQPCFRFTGIYRREPVWVSRTLLTANQSTRFYKRFSGQFGREPDHEDYRLADGRIVKVYPLDLHDELIPMIFGLLWQCPAGYLPEDDDVRGETPSRDIYNDLVKGKCRWLTFEGWETMLRYYGLMQDREPKSVQIYERQKLNFPTGTLFNYIETPPIKRHKRFLDALVAEVLTKAPSWPSFLSGALDTIQYHFIYPSAETARSDEILGAKYVHGFNPDDEISARLAIGQFTGEVLSLPRLGNHNERKDCDAASDLVYKLVTDALARHLPLLDACTSEVTVSHNGVPEEQYWPLTHELGVRTAEQFMQPILPRRHDELINLEGKKFFLVTLTVSW